MAWRRRNQTPIKGGRTESQSVAVIFLNVYFDAGTIRQPRNSKTRFWADFPQFDWNRLSANAFRRKCGPARSCFFGAIRAKSC